MNTYRSKLIERLRGLRGRIPTGLLREDALGVWVTAAFILAEEAADELASDAPSLDPAPQEETEPR